MKNQKTMRENTDEVICYSSKYSLDIDQLDRRQEEMKRRFLLLQSRRGYLERELKAVKTGLLQLDQQMHSYSAYKKMSKQNQCSPSQR